jgi:hypothetical protein
VAGESGGSFVRAELTYELLKLGRALLDSVANIHGPTRRSSTLELTAIYRVAAGRKNGEAPIEAMPRTAILMPFGTC